MKSRKVVLLLALVVVNVWCGIQSCPIKDIEKTKIVSDEINIQSSAYGSKPTTSIDYKYPYPEDFGSVPSTAVGINGFEFDPSSVMGAQITANKMSST